MPIMIKQKDGSLKPFRNADLLPAFYYIPKIFLIKAGNGFIDIPRNLRELVRNQKAMDLVESDIFIELIIDAYAYMAWPFMGKTEYIEIYSGYDPAWKVAHCATLWINMLHIVDVLPTINDMFQNYPPDYEIPFITEAHASISMQAVVSIIFKHNKYKEAFDIIDQYRCFEDYDERNSNQKTDFYRKWYHTRSKYKQISLEQYQEDYAENHDGQSWDLPDEEFNFEDEITSKIMVENFFNGLNKTDQSILQMRIEGYTLDEIASKLNYKTHSAVLKRVRKIGQAYEKYANVDYGFNEKKIV